MTRTADDIFKPEGGLAMARPNEACAQCHRDQTRPFVFDHPAMREGCAACHNPHGSINRMMLNQADHNLCFRCHAQVQGRLQPVKFTSAHSLHTFYLQEGTCWSAGCHTAVHGSDVDPHFPVLKRPFKTKVKPGANRRICRNSFVALPLP